jgi:hypothetical protein
VVLADTLPEGTAEGYEFRIRAVRGPTFVDPRVKAQWDAYFKEVDERQNETVRSLVVPGNSPLTLINKRNITEFEVGSLWSFGDGSGRPMGSARVIADSHQTGIITVSS